MANISLFSVACFPLQNCYSENIGHITGMKITDKNVAYVAALANLELTEAERERMLRDLNSVLDYIALLNELDTANVEPMSHISIGSSGAEHSPAGTREDILEGLRKSLPHDIAVQNAPDSDGTFFRVPKVIER